MDWKSHIEGLLGAGATVDQLASGMGVTPNAIREIRAGRTRSPRADAAFRLAAMKPEQFRHDPASLVITTSVTKRALLDRLGMSSATHLAKVLDLPPAQVVGWADDAPVPALPQVMKLLGHTEQDAPATPINDDPDADRIGPVDTA
ncbi:helix-turn-helix transcriptional regulator [Stenotrophomonas sp. ZAC14D2_NAIMI4_6]|uniref:helix-turn-helix domain-containing protein n=1 Tax=Stenotrophomonas sp. ZAC14D2_NAIMI4_6 TaxID=2072406 RepID=UPI000D53CCD5|nr:helix-turn-helix transcriptional regulator [Stenotrophomonas sp. ZAC14D2_NAIMI4_6]AWH21895.1 hypothetical protein C1933_12090 [Stenotrophomonas sp. ZAC14D2_NAIMI4_6]